MTEAKTFVKWFREMIHVGSGHGIGLESDKPELHFWFYYLPACDFKQVV